MSLFDDLVRYQTTPAQALEAMAMGAKPDSDDRRLLLLLASRIRKQANELHDIEGEISDAWDALGNRNRGHLTLAEQITSALREHEDREQEGV